MSHQIDLGMRPGENSGNIPSPPITQLIFASDGKVVPGAKQRKRSAAMITPDNAEEIFSSCIDLERLWKNLADPTFVGHHDKEAFLQAIVDCVVNEELIPEDVSFSNVTAHHIDQLQMGVPEEELNFCQEAVLATTKSDSKANSVLNAHSFQKDYNLTKYSVESRSIIDQILLAAVSYAQEIIETDTETKNKIIKQCRGSKKHTHLAIFPHFAIEQINVTYNNVSYNFRGFLDYAIGYIRESDVGALGYGCLDLDNRDTVCGIVKANSVEELHNFGPQVKLQVLTLLHLTNRTSFIVALTNGMVWKFYRAQFRPADVPGENDLLSFSVSGTLMVDSHRGLIVEVLKDLMIFNDSTIIQ